MAARWQDLETHRSFTCEPTRKPGNQLPRDDDFVCLASCSRPMIQITNMGDLTAYGMCDYAEPIRWIYLVYVACLIRRNRSPTLWLTLD
jgi:hypothetical protein